MKRIARKPTTFFKTCVALLLGLMSIAIEARAAPIQWPVQAGGNGHYYELVGDYLNPSQRWSWQDSKTMAESLSYLGMQGHLVTIINQSENNFIIDSFHSAHPYPTWLGLTDNEAFGGFESFGQANPQIDGWVWVTGEPVSFTNWSPGNPDNLNDEDFAVMGNAQGNGSLWNDVQSGSGGQAPFFVEFQPTAVPEPSTLAMCLVGAGIAMIFLFARWGG